MYVQYVMYHNTTTRNAQQMVVSSELCYCSGICANSVLVLTYLHVYLNSYSTLKLYQTGN